MSADENTSPEATNARVGLADEAKRTLEC
jgi:hypothetical protein